MSKGFGDFVGSGNRAKPTTNITPKIKNKNNVRKNVETLDGIGFQKFECFGVGSSPYL